MPVYRCKPLVARKKQIAEEIEHLEKVYKTQIIHGKAAIANLWSVINNVLNALVRQPLASDKPELTSQEIADTLKGFEKRHGYAKIEGKVYSVKTLDLGSSVHEEERTQRWGTIISQTKKKYCKGRRELESEIAEAYEIGSPPFDKLDKYEALDDF
jgi:hypothetical protein